MNRHNAPEETEFTARQAEVLEAGLALLVAGGEKALTTAGLARAANCSKESLYKWFGDRDGVLSAMIAFQASKVRVPSLAASAHRDLAAFRADFEGFASDLLAVLSGPASLALNRLAIGQASDHGSALGDLMIARGRAAVRQRAKALLEAARRAGHLRFDDTQDAFEALYGLIVADRHVRMLLGETIAETADPARRRASAQLAIDRFFRLFAAGDNDL